MSRALLVLASQADRDKAISWVRKAPWNTRLTFNAPKRTLPQNDRLWASLGDLASQLTWHGAKLSSADWKLVMMAGLRREMRIVPNIEGNGFVNLGSSSSDLSKVEMITLLELIYAFGAERGVVFHDQRETEEA